MKILVIGASGQVGKYLMPILKRHHEVVGTTFTQPSAELKTLDIRNGHDVAELFRQVQPQAVVLAGALTHVDYCEEHREEAHAVNALGTQNVAVAASAFGAKLIYLSTEYVFDGKDGPYTEAATPHPINTYGETKLEGEKRVQGEYEDFVIVRTTVVFSAHPLETKNFFQQLLLKLSKGEMMYCYTDQVTTPTYAPNLASAVAELATGKLHGIYNVVGKTRLNRYEFALKVAERFHLRKELLQPVTSVERPQRASRPKKAGLVTTKAERALHTSLLTLDEAFQQARRELGR